MKRKDIIVQVGNLLDKRNYDNPTRGRVYSIDGIAPTIDTMTGGQRAKNNNDP